MYDPYSEPNYNPGGSPAPQQQGFQMPKISMPSFEMPEMQGPSINPKKLITIIVLLIVILIIAFVAFNWIASQKEVTIKILDASGEAIDARLILKDAKGEKVTLNPKTGPASTYKATLISGTTYSATITAEGYKPVTNKTIEFTGEKDRIDLNMAKDITAEIILEDLEFNEIFDGQTIAGKIQVNNTGNNKILLTDIIDQTTAPLQSTIIKNDITEITPGGSVFIDYNIKIRAATKITEQKKSIISFNIAGSTIKSNEKELQVLPSVSSTEITVTPTTGSFSKTDLIAGNETTIKIKTANNNQKTPAKNIILTVIPNPGYETQLTWFEFSQSVQGKKYSKIIESIDPKKFEESTLYIRTPITAQAQTEFKGYLLIQSYSIKGTKNPDLLYRISTERTAAAKIINTPINSPITINCSKTSATCETKRYSNGEVYMTNTGNTDIPSPGITIELDLQQSDATCQQYLLKYATMNSTDTKKIPKLDAGEKTPILIDITAPGEAPNKSSTRCILKWKYIDPLSSPSKLIDPIPSLAIEINKLEN